MTNRTPSRALLALLAAFALLVAACGDGDDSAAEASAPDDVAGDSADARTLEDATGPVELPSEYERAVPTDGVFAAYMLSLGVEPAALASDVKLQMSTIAEYFSTDVDLDALPEIGLQYEMNMEALAAARPDLIIASDWEAEESEDAFRRIAPTFFVPWGTNGEWRERFRLVGEALGRDAEAGAVSDEFDEFVASLPSTVTDQTVAFVRAESLTDIRADILDTSFAGSVASEAGIPLLDLSDQVDIEEDASWVELSEENLGLLSDADVIVIADLSFYDPAIEPTDAVLSGSPLWGTLPAVEAGRVVMVPGPIYNGGNYQAATALLQAIADAVAS